MTPGIKPGLVPPEVGQDKEEPELAQEDDIPSDDRGDHPGNAPGEADRPERE